MRTLNVKVQTLNVKGALKPVIATVTFPILSITKIRIDRLLDSLGLDDHQATASRRTSQSTHSLTE